MMGRLSRMLAKLLGLIVLYPLSRCVPRDPALWVFGAPYEKCADNSKYLFLWANLNRRDQLRAVWISGSADTVRALREQGHPALLRWSWRGLWTCLRAGKFVFSAYLDEINVYASAGAYKINLWHGAGLKKVEFKITTGPLARSLNTAWFNPYRLLRPARFIRPDAFLAPSPLMSLHFAECFRIGTHQCIEGSYPRLQASFDPQLLEAAARGSALTPLLAKTAAFSRVYIYVPTWRDSGLSTISRAFPDMGQLDRTLNASDSLLVIKAHPNEDMPELSGYQNMMAWPANVDLYTALHTFDCLITDYSSVLYDYLAMGGTDVLLYNFDFDEYITNSREFAYPYEENVYGNHVRDFSALLDLLAKPTTARPAGKLNEIADRFFAWPQRDCAWLMDVVAARASSR